MSIVETFCSKVGTPHTLRYVKSGAHVVAAVGRWKHHGVNVDFGAADTGRIIFNVSGQQRVKVSGVASETFQPVQAGSVHALAPGDRCNVAVSGEADAIHMFISHGLLAAAKDTVPIRRHSVERGLQAAAVRAFVAIAGEDDSTGHKLRAIVLHVADLLAAPAALEDETPQNGLSAETLKRIHAFVDERLANEVFAQPPVCEIAAVAGLSMRHFARAFHRSAGQTPYAYASLRRLNTALALMLQSSSIHVDEVAEQLGYSSPSHFISSFRAQFGVTPGVIQRSVGQSVR